MFCLACNKTLCAEHGNQHRCLGGMRRGEEIINNPDKYYDPEYVAKMIPKHNVVYHDHQHNDVEYNISNIWEKE